MKSTLSIANLKRLMILTLALFSLTQVSNALAIDAPNNIRIENSTIFWDVVDNASSYNIYYLDRPVVDFSVTPRYLATVNNGREFRPTTPGYYTVVSVGQVNGRQQFSDVAQGVVVLYQGTTENAALVTASNLYEIRSQRCDNVVAGGSCEVHCSNADRRIPTGGACRADADVVLHQRARNDSFECITQNDTAFIEADVYCLDTTKFSKP